MSAPSAVKKKVRPLEFMTFVLNAVIYTVKSWAKTKKQETWDDE